MAAEPSIMTFSYTHFQAFCPDAYLLIEHLPDEKVPLARQALLQKASEAGVEMIW